MAEIVGIVVRVLGPAVELGKSIAAPIKRQFSYLFCFSSNIQSLRDEAKKLDDARAGLQMRVDVAERNAEVIVPEVKTWLTSANNEIQVNMSGFETEIPNVQSGCLTIKSRFLLSRKARKTTEAMQELRSHCNFNPISQPAPPASMAPPVPLGDAYEFQSRKQIEEDIMEALRSKNVNMMGICGMGGIGKTTMVKRLMNRVREENLFDEVVMVVVGQQVDVLKLQQEFAESLGLNLEKETLFARANKLHARLTGNKKRILVVLDDVWEKLKLEHVGIPCESGLGCTILLTSRNRNVLNHMDVQKLCAVQTLSETEAWFLFQEKVGNWLEDSNLLSIAKEVAQECKGLPIALTTVGCALKDKSIKPIWEDALHQLKTSNPIDIPDVLGEVYNPLKLSYKSLRNQHAESLFLLCCLFPEDFDIGLEYLTFYCVGLCMVEGLRNLEQARNRVSTLVEMLRSRSLLLDGSDEHHVKMHDVVRDVAIYIASEEGLIVDSTLNSYTDCKWISVFPERRSEFHNLTGLNFPGLRLLLMHFLDWEKIEIKQDLDFFEGMKELNVLSLESISLQSLPQTTQLLKNLRTLYLELCTLETISVVGELLSLEILCCRSCNRIKELPTEIGRLKRLKLLEFSYCRSLKTIAPGVISNLVELEELKIVKSFKGWDSAENMVSLNELESLPNLTFLEVEIDDYNIVAKEICLSSMQRIVKYDIGINALISNHGAYEKCMQLDLPRAITLGSWIHMLLRSTEFLVLGGDGSNNLDLLGAHKYLKSLRFRNCSTVKKMVNPTKSIDFGGVFPSLEYLMLSDLSNLEEICDGSIPEGSDSFKNLKKVQVFSLPALKHLWKSPYQNVSLSNLSSIYIQNCGKLRNLFSLTITKDALLQLESLQIQACGMMEEIFSDEELNKKDGQLDQSHRRIIAFTKLKTLILRYLENLTTFCNGIESIEFPVLAEMYIRHCPKLMSLVSFVGNNHQSSAEGHGHGHDDDTFHLFCSQKVTFGTLKKLEIRGYNNISKIWCYQIPLDFLSGLERLTIGDCGRIRSLFPSSVAGNLINLNFLEIQNCREMEKVIGDEVKLREKSPFHRLEELVLKGLTKLRSFCKWSCDLELPSLKYVSIDDCPVMQNFTMGSLSTIELRVIKINKDKLEDVRDLNDAIRQLHFKADERLRAAQLKETRGRGFRTMRTYGKIKEEEIEEIC